MKKSVQLFLFIMIGLFIADRLVYVTLSSIEKKVFIGHSVGKVNYFLKVKDSVDILIFGNSRAGHHVDPKVFNVPAFNMGVDGTHIGYSCALISTLKKENHIILVHIDPNELFENKYEGNDALVLLLKRYDDERLNVFFKSYFEKEIVLSNISKCYAYNRKVLGIVKNYITNYNEQLLFYDGFEPLVPTEEQQRIFRTMLENKKGSFNSNIKKPLVINPKFENFIDDMINISKINKSKLIFFTSPSLNKVDDEVKVTTKEFFREKQVLYMDYIDFFNETDISIWKDYTHLSRKGAILFSKELYKSLEEIK